VAAASNRNFVAAGCWLGAEQVRVPDPGGRFQSVVLPAQNMWIVEVLLGIVVTASYLLQVEPRANYLEALARKIVVAETVNFAL
jgi:hypothetical protein